MERDGLDRKTGLTLLAAVYGAVTLQVLLVRYLGGLGHVPMLLFGSCQYGPAILVLLLAPGWRGRLWHLLRARPSARFLGSSYLLAAGTLVICTVVPYLAGQLALHPSEPWSSHYALRSFLPMDMANPFVFAAFVVLVAPLFHLLNALGEEVYWRGYLQDWLAIRISAPKAWMVAGVLWGIWHAPMILLLGWDFPGAPVAGVLAITLSQLFWSVVMGRITRAADNLWPAVLLHATANAMTIGLYDVLINPEMNLFYSPWGLLGGVLMALVAAPTLLRGRASSTERKESTAPGGAMVSTRLPKAAY